MKGLKFVLHVTWTQCCEDWNRTVKGGNMNTGGEIINFFFLGLVHMRLKKYRLDVLNVGNSVFKANVFFFLRLIPNHLHLLYDC